MESNGQDKAAPKTTTTRVAVISESEQSDKWRRMAQIGWAGAALAIALAVAWVVVLLTTRYSDSTDAVSTLSQANAEIIEQNADLQTQVAALQDENDAEREADACYSQYTASITNANALFNTTALGDLLVNTLRFILADDPNYTGPAPNLSDIGEDLDAVEQAREAYYEAIAERDQWIANGSPLPCPAPTPTEVVVPE